MGALKRNLGTGKLLLSFYLIFLNCFSISIAQTTKTDLFIGEPLKVKLNGRIYRVGKGYWIDSSKGIDTNRRLENGKQPLFIIDEEGMQIDNKYIIEKVLFLITPLSL